MCNKCDVDFKECKCVCKFEKYSVLDIPNAFMCICKKCDHDEVEPVKVSIGRV
jgi:hypothetical protein